LFSIFKNYHNLVVAISEKKDGSMKFTGNILKDKKILRQRKNFLNKLNINPELVVNAELSHRDGIKVVEKKNRDKTVKKTDGLLTSEKNLFLAITVADCLPIFIFDFQKEIVGLVHGGWRGLSKDILFSALQKLKREFKSNTKNILVGIGPGISKCHFEVNKRILRQFKYLPRNSISKRNDKTFLDLKKIAQYQALGAGIKKQNIEINPDCTYCLKDKYFSFRRYKPKTLQAMMAVIGIRESTIVVMAINVSTL